MKRRNVRWLGAIGAILMLLACNGKPAAESNGGADSAGAGSAASSADSAKEIVMTLASVQHGGVRWQQALTRDVSISTEVPGQLAPNEDRTARLGAPARARVVAVHVQVGSRVGAGQPLVTLQSPEASTARADYNKAMADLNAKHAAATFAKTARERADRLLVAKAIAKQEYERAQIDEELAKAELTRAEAEAARTRAQLEQLGVSSEGGSMVVKAPIGGVVLSREAIPGTVVEAGAPLVSVSDPSTLWLDIAVTDRAASSLRSGSRVRFRVPAAPVDTFEARVVSVGGALDPQTRTVPVHAIAQNPTGRLRAQMFATVWLEGAERRQVVTVPEGAVMLLDQRPVVFVARPSNEAVRFERRDVVVGGTFGGAVQILNGLQPGEQVVTDGAFAVKSQFSRAKQPSEG